jgi:asparagine synthase (glutamine-hydrolysing)
MCGIAGIYSSTVQTSEKEFQLALHTLKKRGPNAEGIYAYSKGFLGHTRLSILDTSEAANQPMLNETEDYVLVFNGEIFNFQELKKTKLHSFSIPFKTNSDTEVLLYLLIHFGTKSLNWLSGFFAFAFLQKSTNTLLLARDRYGKKPLFIYQKEEELFFASEMKALLALPMSREINLEALAMYFQLNYLPTDKCMLQDVRKVKPGHFVQIKNQKIEEGCYYKIHIQSDKYAIHKYEDAQKHVEKLLANSVQQRMISDVPLGAFLSGGIDSSVIVALASQYTDKLKTFTVGYKDNKLFDETYYANLVAQKYNTDHHVFYLSETEFKEEVFHVLDYLDEPFADSSCIPQFILSKYTKQHVTVALSGDGGDEVFAGYTKHAAEWMMRHNAPLSILAKLSAPLLRKLPASKNTKIGNITRQLVKLGNGAQLSNAERYIRWCSILDEENVCKLLSISVQQQLLVEKLIQDNWRYANPIQSNDFNEILLTDMQLILPGDMLYKVDMMSMANSLEVRCPLLDYKLVDFAFQLPSDFKIDRKFKKKIIQDTFRSYLPSELYNRPKMGFEIPLLQWFRKDFYNYIFENLLEERYIEQQGLFSFPEIQRIKEKTAV